MSFPFHVALHEMRLAGLLERMMSKGERTFKGDALWHSAPRIAPLSGLNANLIFSLHQYFSTPAICKTLDKVKSNHLLTLKQVIYL